MERKVFILIVTLCGFVYSCKKEAQPLRKPSFNLMVTEHARWYLHCQGEVVATPSGYKFDSSLHNYSTVIATGLDTVVDGKTYYLYDVRLERYRTNQHIGSASRLLLFREDTVEQKIYIHNSLEGVVFAGDRCAVDYSGKELTRETYGYARGDYKTGFPDGSFELDGFLIDKMSAKVKGNTVFFKAKGIGGPYGLCSTFAGIEGMHGNPRSLDFVYKGDTIHIDYGPL